MMDKFELKIGDSIFIRLEAEYLKDEEPMIRILNMIREHYGHKPEPIPIRLFDERDYIRLKKENFK